jgi:nucleoid-associated protein YgaU
MSVSSRPSVIRIATFAIIALLLVGAGVTAGLGYRYDPGSAPKIIVASAPPVPAPAPPAPPQPAPAVAAPAFDIVRVAPDGGTVLAGRAEPGATVTVQESGHTVGKALADSRGSWVMLPATKLPSGPAELTLSAQAPSGPAKMADAPVLVVVPSPAAAAVGKPSAPAFALLVPPSAPSVVLQAPVQPGTTAPAKKLGLDTVDYDEHGAIRFSGSAPANAPVRMYVDNAPVGDAKAGAEGHWSMSPPTEVEPGVHSLRLDQLTPEGRVASRVELPFQRETVALAQVANGQVVVQPGQNLWRLARRAYGAGIRYTVIFMANRDQIRDARLIYPGQVFAMPDEASATLVSH